MVFDKEKSEMLCGVVCYRGNENIIKTLIEQNADVNYISRTGWTPLTFAANNRMYENVILLIEHGANKDQPNEYGVSPLIAAARTGSIKIVKYLISIETNIDVKDDTGNSYLDILKDYILMNDVQHNLSNYDGENLLRFFGIINYLNSFNYLTKQEIINSIIEAPILNLDRIKNYIEQCNIKDDIKKKEVVESLSLIKELTDKDILPLTYKYVFSNILSDLKESMSGLYDEVERLNNDKSPEAEEHYYEDGWVTTEDFNNNELPHEDPFIDPPIVRLIEHEAERDVSQNFFWYDS
jgi:hypothetical protein